MWCKLRHMRLGPGRCDPFPYRRWLLYEEFVLLCADVGCELSLGSTAMWHPCLAGCHRRNSEPDVVDSWATLEPCSNGPSYLQRWLPVADTSTPTESTLYWDSSHISYLTEHAHVFHIEDSHSRKLELELSGIGNQHINAWEPRPGKPAAAPLPSLQVDSAAAVPIIQKPNSPVRPQHKIHPLLSKTSPRSHSSSCNSNLNSAHNKEILLPPPYPSRWSATSSLSPNRTSNPKNHGLQIRQSTVALKIFYLTLAR